MALAVDSDEAALPSLETVLLSAEDEVRLDQSYCTIGGDTPQDVQIPRFDAFPSYQRTQRKVGRVTHSTATWRVVRAYRRMQDAERYSNIPRQSQIQTLDDDPAQTCPQHMEPEESLSDNELKFQSSRTVSELEETEMANRY